MTSVAWSDHVPLMEWHDEEDRTVRTSVHVLDSFLHGLRPSTVTLIDGRQGLMPDLPTLLLASGVGALDRDAVWVDGGCTADPYDLGRASRRLGLDRSEVLDAVHVARAFTAYQLVTLVDEKLEDEADRTDAGMVLVSCLTDMFRDKEMRDGESLDVLAICLAKLRRLASRGLVVLVTERGPPGQLKDMVYGAADDVIRLERSHRGIRIVKPMTGETMMYKPAPRHQTTLAEWGR